jgi:hypothetical protein
MGGGFVTSALLTAHGHVRYRRLAKEILKIAITEVSLYPKLE